MKPDYNRAAIAATETLIKYRVSSAPVIPLPILKSMPGVLVLSFAEMASDIGVDRKNVVSMFGAENQDAVTTVSRHGDSLRYVVTYNQRLPFYVLHRALARELGHIILRHDGSLPEDVRAAEADCFARYFLCPRPVLKAIEQAGIRLSVEVVGNVTGCYARYQKNLSTTPGVLIAPELNRLVADQFADYIDNFVSYQSSIAHEDNSADVDFGTYFDNYEK